MINKKVKKTAIPQKVKESKSPQKQVQARKDGSLEESNPERAKDNGDQSFTPSVGLQKTADGQH